MAQNPQEDNNTQYANAPDNSGVASAPDAGSVLQMPVQNVPSGAPIQMPVQNVPPADNGSLLQMPVQNIPNNNPEISAPLQMPTRTLGDYGFGDSEPQEQSFSVNGAPISQSAMNAANPSGNLNIAAKPISQQDFATSQVQSLEGKKFLLGSQAEAEGSAAKKEADINARAAQEQDLITNGDPIKFQKASTDLQLAKQALAVAKPGSQQAKDAQLAFNTARVGMQMNLGQKESWAKSQMDAEQRDNDLREQIRKTASEHQLTASESWNNRSTAGKILGGIGIILGGWGGGLAKTGKNAALEVINNAINSDIESSKADISNHWKSISQQHELDDNAYNRELHNQAWANNFRTAALERVKLELSQNAAASRSDLVKINAAKGIQDLTDQQNQIKYNQTVLGQQAAQANAARLRGLAKDFTGDVKAYAEKEGVSFEDAQRAVAGLPEYRPLLGAGAAYTPQVVLDDHAIQQHVLAAQAAIQAGMDPTQAKTKFGITPDVEERFNKSVNDVGIIVPTTKNKETNKDLDSRTVGWKDGERILAADSAQATEYKDKQGAAQQWDAGTLKLQQLAQKAKQNGGLDSQDLATWEATRSDMISIYGVMKEGAKRLPNEPESHRIAEDIIGNPPRSLSGLNPLSNASIRGVNPLSTDTSDRVDARMQNLSNLSKQARDAAGLALHSNAGPTAQPANPGAKIQEYNLDGTPKK